MHNDVVLTFEKGKYSIFKYFKEATIKEFVNNVVFISCISYIEKNV